MLQGIYRVSGVKSKVESLCQRFDLNPELVDLEEVHPNIISNVLKLYLRQVRMVTAFPAQPTYHVTVREKRSL